MELRIERLQLTFRFTYAFHAREVRFERDSGDGFVRVFPETFSFHAHRHDPAELYLQFDDLARKPKYLSPRASRRDADVLISRLVLALPRYLEGVLTRLEREGRLDDRALARVYEDLALLSQMLLRFAGDKAREDQPGIRTSSRHLRKLAFRTLMALVQRRVAPGYLAAEEVDGLLATGGAKRFDPNPEGADRPHDAGAPVGGLPGQPHRRGVDRLGLILERIAGQLDGVGTEGVRLDDLRAGQAGERTLPVAGKPAILLIRLDQVSEDDGG